MRTHIDIYDPFNRDTRWITQEVITEYVGARIRSPIAAEYCLMKWSGGDKLRIDQFNELITDRPELDVLEAELIDEYGMEFFIGKPKPKEYHIRQLELAIERTQDKKELAALYKELREMQGWTTKPTERGVGIVINNGTPGEAPKIDANNPREAERIVMSYFSAVDVR